MDKNHLTRLLKKRHAGTISPAERKQLDIWYNRRLAEGDLAGMSAEETAQVLAKLAADVRRIPNRRAHGIRVGKIRKVAAAAAVLLVCSFAIYRYFPPIPAGRLVARDINAPTNRAMVTLPDGRVLEAENLAERMDSSGNLRLAELEQTFRVEDFAEDAEAEITVSTPKSGKSKLLLPDGSLVWLNADSKISYPVHYGRENRKITLVGEAFFEVEKRTDPQGKAIPFTVHTAGQQIAVLGTRFNVHAYPETEKQQTTLLSGSIALRAQEEIVLKPNEQCEVTPGGMLVRSIDAEEIAAWKDGLIILKDATFAEVVQIIERAYDVDFVHGELPGTHRLNGELYTTVKLSELLKVLELNTGLAFEVRERTVLVKDP